MPVQNAVITAQQMTKLFGGEAAVNNVTFQVPAGSIFGFIGPSGSGKTTTIRLLTGVYRPDAGDVVVLGRQPWKFHQRDRARLGYMPQLFVLYPHLTVWENLSFAASIYGMSLRRRKILNDVLDFVELGDSKSKLANNISGGMQRRLSLASTLVHNPELIFLDEPTAGIDPILRRKFWDHFNQLKGQGRTLFITTQYVNEAAYCDLVAVMAEGKLITVDTPVGLRHRAFGGEIIELRSTRPMDYRTDQMLQSMPLVTGRIVRTSPSSVRVTVKDAATAIPQLIEWSRKNNLNIEAVEEYLPPFDDVFVELVREGVKNA
jgi:ABC-2 type transport system ATP-binding protein